MFGNASAPSRIYTYGVFHNRLDAESSALVEEQFTAAHRYYNQLVEIERWRRDERWAVMVRMRPVVGALHEQWQALDELVEKAIADMKAKNAKARSRNTEGAQAVKKLKEECRAAWVSFRTARNLARESRRVRNAQGKVDAAAKEKLHAARAASGVYWGTYLVVEAAVRAAASSAAPPAFKRRHVRSVPPRLPAHITDRLAVQVQGGMTIDDLFGSEDQRLRVEIIAGTRPKSPLCWLSFRVGSDAQRKPIWARIKFIMHRPLPPGALVKWCYLTRRCVATHEKWEVHFVLSASDASCWAKPTVENGTVGIDVGWRRLPHGLRVAYWCGDDGRHGELVLSERWLEQMDQVRELRSIRDLNFDAARSQLRQWMGERGDLPDYLSEIRPHVSLWKSQQRLGELVVHWREHRFPGDQSIFDALEAWRKQDRHLHNWEGHLRDQLVAQRRDIYRNFVAELRRSYKTASVESLDLRKFARKKGPDEAADDGAVRQHRTNAALSHLKAAIRDSGMVIVEQEAQNTTRRCHLCGHVNHFDDQSRLAQACGECGAEWDQDFNAAFVLRDAASGGMARSLAGAARE